MKYVFLAVTFLNREILKSRVNESNDYINSIFITKVKKYIIIMQKEKLNGVKKVFKY